MRVPIPNRFAPSLLLCFCLTGCYLGIEQTVTVPPTWWKGNTHTHTLWSDGNAAPEHVVQWYTDHGYDFLILSDHNILQENEDAWFPILEGERLTRARVDALRAQFGEDWVEERTRDNQQEMRLKTLPELRHHFERPDQFILITGEEITDGFEDRPVHINGLNLAELIQPQGGTSVPDVMQRNIDAVIAQGERLNRPVLAHINHPNFQWGLTPEDVASIEGERFFEVYNGHSGVRNEGDSAHVSTETLWDIALTQRLTVRNLGLLYGLATDDSHEYFEQGLGFTNPGRGWVMVRTDTLSAAHIINAMQQGHFYATSGVTLRNFSSDDTQYTVTIAEAEAITYSTQFIGTRLIDGAPGPTGEVLFETTENPAVYAFQGDELYVRATVTSSRRHPNPYAEGDFEQAWIQPVTVTRVTSE